MSKPWLLVVLLLLIVLSSQFGWNQQLGNEIVEESLPETSGKEDYAVEREEAVKEKIILSQEKSIQRLREIVWSLRRQLQQCSGGVDAVNSAATPSEGLQIELERIPV